MIRFGMGLMEIVEQLTRGFMKATGKQPGNLEKLKIQQEAVQRFKDMNKVMDMQGRPIDPSKPIMGGSQQGEALKSGIMKATGARPRQVLSEDEIRQKLLKNNEEGLASMKSKLDDPEKKAMGGRIGYAGGSDMGTVADSKGNVGPSKGGYQGGGTGPVERPSGGGGGNNNNTTYDYTIPKQIVKQTAINTVKNLGRRELMNTLGLAKFSNPIGIAMALKSLYDQTQNPTLTEEEAMGGGITGMDISTLQSSPYENMSSQFKADGGRIGYKVGSKGKAVEGLINLIKNKFGKKAVTTGDKAPIPPKTLERDMFKAADNRINKKEGVFMEDGKTPDYDYYKEILDDAEDSMGFNVAGDETIEELLKREKTLKDYEADMYDQYKTGKLDPEPGSKSQARLNLLKKRKEEAELTDDYRLFSSDDADELDELEEFLDQDYKRVKAEQAEEQAVKELAPKMVERLKLKQKYPGITDDLLDKILIDDNPQRKAEVLGSLDETFKMMEKGMSPDEIIDAFKNQNRTKQADGGIMRANFVGGGMGRRGFLKMLGGVGAGIGALKTGILGFGGKGATKEVAKEVVKNSSGKPPAYFFKLAEKIKKFGSDSTPTNERTISKSLKSKDGTADYILEEDMATGDIQIKKVNMERDDMINDIEIMEFRKGEVVEGPGGKPVKTPDEYDEVTETTSRIYKDDYNPSSYEDGIRQDAINQIVKEVDEAPSIKIKKAGGGIARMLGE